MVKDTAGAVLAGVAVEASSPALIEKTRTAETDRQGAYKIVGLRPGPYTVRFTMPGFTTVIREGLELPSSFTATINADMRAGTVEETVTVSGEGPILDTQNVANKAVTSRQLMDALPTDRNFTSLASMTPGMQVVGTLQHVGGSDPETRLMLRTHGSRIGERPGTLYGDRIYQIDVRFNKTVRVGRTVIRPMVSVYNLLNANPVLSYSTSYGPSWPAPLAIPTARFVDVGVQVDL